MTSALKLFYLNLFFPAMCFVGLYKFRVISEIKDGAAPYYKNRMS